MMTYGWAILIIVIVAAVLYSLGIFNPSASVTATVTGFAGLGNVEALCFPQGLELSVSNNIGQLINITRVNLTSSAGNTQTITPNRILQPDSSVILFVPEICPNTVGSHFSVAATIAYTEPQSVFNSPQFSDGQISGSTERVLNYGGWSFGTYTNPQNTSFVGYSKFGISSSGPFPIKDLDVCGKFLNNCSGCPAEGFTATAHMYFPGPWVNFSGIADDLHVVFYKLASSNTWSVGYQTAPGHCCQTNSTNISVAPGIYNVRLQYENTCAGGGNLLMIKNAFMEYSDNWNVITWDGGPNLNSDYPNSTVPPGDTQDGAGLWNGSWN
jgi:hypothetical protein